MSDIEEDAADQENLELLLDQLREICNNNGEYDIEDVWNESKASNILEATNNNIDISAQLYWDDFLASQQNPPDPPGGRNRQEDQDDSSEDEESDDNPNAQRPIMEHSSDEDDPPPIAAALRRRLFEEQRVPEDPPVNFEPGRNFNSISDDEQNAHKRIIKRQKITDGYLSDHDWILDESNSDEKRTFAPTTAMWGMIDESDPHAMVQTWMNAGFSLLYEKGVGCELKAPSADDLTYYCWQQRVPDDTKIPTPYHCRGLTLLLSVVTAVLYTKSSSHNHNNNSLMEALQEKEADDDYPISRQFEGRLADALTHILTVSARASMDRKQRAIDSLELSDETEYEKLTRKLKLVPTCWWEYESGTGDYKIPEADGMHCPVHISVSYTNVDDLRSYVVANLRNFVNTGGCILFLETIARIHGAGAIAHMQGSKQQLIHCTCNERHHATIASKKPSALKQLKQQARANPLLDTTPPSHECVGVELLSLLLCGTIHKSLTGWSSGLGIGVLSHCAAVGCGLTRPDYPVWLVQGPTNYSVVYLSGCYEKAFSKENIPDAVATLTHWDCWQESRHATHFRLVVDRAIVNSSKSNDQNEPEFDNASLQLLAARQKRTKLETIARNTVEDNDAIQSDQILSQLEAHPRDMEFYKNNFRLWRYRFDAGTEDWCPYFKLSDALKRVVEQKYGPAIVTILRTRWPKASIILSGHSPVV